MCEQAVVTVRASVLLYDDAGKQWVPSGTSTQQEVSRVQVFHHVQQNTFRLVGRKLQDQEVVVNCAIGRGFKYNITSDTFHQWKDQQVVYGLNFVSHDDANSFGTAMVKVIEMVNSSTCGLPSQNIRPATVCRPTTAAPARPMANGIDYFDDRNNVYAQSRRTVNEPAGGPYAPAGYAAAATCSSAQVVVMNSPQRVAGGQVAPTPPVTQTSAPGGGIGARRQPSINAKKPIIASNAPPPPPLPNMGTSKPCNGPLPNKPTTLADALAAAKLRKVSTPAASNDGKGSGSRSASVGSIDVSANFARSSGTASVPSFGHDDVISEITATLARRKMLQESQAAVDNDIDADNGQPSRIQENADNNSRKSLRPAASDAASHRKVPSGSSLSSQEENAAVAASASAQGWQRGMTNGHSSASLATNGGSSDVFELLKQEIVQCIKEEMGRAKTELVESLRNELSRQLKVIDMAQQQKLR